MRHIEHAPEPDQVCSERPEPVHQHNEGAIPATLPVGSASQAHLETSKPSFTHGGERSIALTAGEPRGKAADSPSARADATEPVDPL
jgi:hypothetical protein